MSDYLKAISAAAEYIGGESEVGIVLGSGWGEFADLLERPAVLRYEDIPGFSGSGVAGHAGIWVTGELSGVRVSVMSGRFHFYEGYDMKEVTLPIRVMCALGIDRVILTNAAGGVNTGYSVGDIMLISDHINLTGRNPLLGKNISELGPRFPDMSEVYDRALRASARAAAESLGIGLREGVYAQMTGPMYETPAEIRMLRALGADAVGMSTVPEAVAAAHGGMRVMGISLITNMAAGVLDQPLAHEEVMAAGRAAAGSMCALLSETVKRI